MENNIESASNNPFEGITRLNKENGHAMTEDNVKHFDELKIGELISFNLGKYSDKEDALREDWVIESFDRPNLKVTATKTTGSYTQTEIVPIEYIN